MKRAILASAALLASCCAADADPASRKVDAAPAAASRSDPPSPPPRPGISPFSHLRDGPPSPPPRPDDLLSYAPEAPARESTLPKAEADAACMSLLANADLVTVAKPAISGENGCGIAAPVSLEAVILQDKRRVEISPAPVMRCDLAARVGAFVRESVAPVTEAYGRKVKRVVTADAYDCRGRNRQAGAKLSEHAFGGAIDLSAIEFVDGSILRLAAKTNDQAVATALKDSACARFSTVLGPGSDGYHEDHIHLDLAQRHNGYKICQWTLR